MDVEGQETCSLVDPDQQKRAGWLTLTKKSALMSTLTFNGQRCLVEKSRMVDVIKGSG